MIYLDNSATTPLLPEVLATYHTVSERYFANPSSIHTLGVEAHQLLQQARQQIAQLLGYADDEIFFASSGTEVNNWVLQKMTFALQQERFPERHQIIISAVEHPSIHQQAQWLKQLGFEVVICPVTPTGQVDVAQLKQLLNHQVIMVSTMAVNNEMGAKQPLAEIADVLLDYPQVAWHVDAVQAVTCELASLQHSRIDCLSLSSHKFHAPRGVGILAKRQRMPLLPLLYGGGQEQNGRSSTENVAAIAATAKALRIVASDQGAVHERLVSFRQQLVAVLEHNGWVVFGGETVSPHVICAALSGIPGEVLVNAFGNCEVYLSTTSACSSRAHHGGHHTLGAMGVSPRLSNSAIRISLSRLTTEAELGKLCQLIPQVTQQFYNGRN